MEPPDRDEATEFIMMIPRKTGKGFESRVPWLNPSSVKGDLSGLLTASTLRGCPERFLELILSWRRHIMLVFKTEPMDLDKLAYQSSSSRRSPSAMYPLLTDSSHDYSKLTLVYGY